jgi:hypothetical protein
MRACQHWYLLFHPHLPTYAVQEISRYQGTATMAQRIREGSFGRVAGIAVARGWAIVDGPTSVRPRSWEASAGAALVAISVSV